MTSPAAVIVTYLPDISVANNIRLVATQVHTVFIIDNSPGDSGSRLRDVLNLLPNVSWYFQGENTGIAEALNVGCQMAAQAGFEWILTLDQDTRVTESLVDNLFAHVINSRVAIVAPTVRDDECGRILFKEQIDPRATAPPVVITSGNLLRLAAWEHIGGFDSRLFIDAVDIDLCLRLHRSGWRIFRDPNSTIFHRLGSEYPARLLWATRRVRTYSGFRRYFQMRNAVILTRRHFTAFPGLTLQHLGRLILVWVKLFLIERHLLISMYRGLSDGLRTSRRVRRWSPEIAMQNRSELRALVERASSIASV